MRRGGKRYQDCMVWLLMCNCTYFTVTQSTHQISSHRLLSYSSRTPTLKIPNTLVPLKLQLPSRRLPPTNRMLNRQPLILNTRLHAAPETLTSLTLQPFVIPSYHTQPTRPTRLASSRPKEIRHNDYSRQYRVKRMPVHDALRFDTCTAGVFTTGQTHLTPDSICNGFRADHA